jgi:hypothetical protein
MTWYRCPAINRDWPYSEILKPVNKPNRIQSYTQNCRSKKAPVGFGSARRVSCNHSRCWSGDLTTWKVNPLKEPLKVGVILRHFTLSKKPCVVGRHSSTTQRWNEICLPSKGKSKVHPLKEPLKVGILRDFFPFKGTLYSRETFVHNKAMERDLFTLQRKLES